jgi:hypothetical protein
MKKILSSLLAAATLAGGMITAPAAEARDRTFVRPGGHALVGGNRQLGYAGRHNGWAGRQAGWSGRRYGYGGRGYGYGRRGYYGGYGGYGGYDDGGDAVAAGIAGLAVGAVLGGALSQHHYHANGSCAARFRSYSAASGTYLGNDGLRHPCP